MAFMKYYKQKLIDGSYIRFFIAAPQVKLTSRTASLNSVNHYKPRCSFPITLQKVLLLHSSLVVYSSVFALNKKEVVFLYMPCFTDLPIALGD